MSLKPLKRHYINVASLSLLFISSTLHLATSDTAAIISRAPKSLNNACNIACLSTKHQWSCSSTMSTSGQLPVKYPFSLRFNLCVMMREGGRWSLFYTQINVCHPSHALLWINWFTVRVMMPSFGLVTKSARTQWTFKACVQSLGKFSLPRHSLRRL